MTYIFWWEYIYLNPRHKATSMRMKFESRLPLRLKIFHVYTKSFPYGLTRQQLHLCHPDNDDYHFVFLKCISSNFIYIYCFTLKIYCSCKQRILLFITCYWYSMAFDPFYKNHENIIMRYDFRDFSIEFIWNMWNNFCNSGYLASFVSCFEIWYNVFSFWYL